MRTPKPLSLRPSDKRNLQDHLRTEKDAKMWQRYNCILLCTKKPRREVAEEINMSYRNLQRIVAAYKKNGIDNLRYKIPPGRPPEISEEKRKEIISTIDKNPHGWETKQIKELIIKETGVVYTNRHITRIAHRWGFSKVVPRPRNRRMNPSKVRYFKKRPRR